MSSNPQEYKNENISVTFTDHPGCRCNLEVTVSPLATQASYQKAIKLVAKEVSIPGFRKGKAPQDMIIKKYGQHVEREWKDILLNSTFHEAVQLIKIYPFNKSSVSKASIKSISLQDGAKLTYEFEAAPNVPSIEVDQLTITDVPRASVTDKDVKDTIEVLRLQHAQWNEVTDRPAAENDFVDITIDAIEDQGYNICKNTRFEIAAGKMGIWMRNLLIGMTPGQSAEKMSEKEPHDDECKKCESGEHHHHAHEDFKPTLCRITLHSIKTPTLPEINSEFSKKFGIETVEELTTRVEEDLNKQAEEEQLTSLRKLMEFEILSKYPFDVPRSLVQDQVENQVESIEHELVEKNIPQDQLEAETLKIKENVANRLARDYCLFFLAQQVVKDNNIQITEQHITNELMRQMWLQQSGQSIIHKDMKPEEVRSRLYANVMVSEAIDYLIDHAKKRVDQQAN